VNHIKAGLVNDKGKYLIMNASSAEASPSCIKYRAMCSTVLVSSFLENFVKSAGALTLCGKAVGVLDRQTCQGGTRGSRLCVEDRDRETENSKVCTRTRDTRFIQVQAAKVANPTSCLGDQVWCPALGVG
jgi:hypothetical protein